jgi:SAM-dependent methyltransferase
VFVVFVLRHGASIVVASGRRRRETPWVHSPTVARAVIGRTREYGPYVIRGKSNLGRCPICERRTLFVERSGWLRDDYFCVRCESIPRYRALVAVIEGEFPDWRNMEIHEFSPWGPGSQKLKSEAALYSDSAQEDGIPSGHIIDGEVYQNLESVTFSDESFDLVVTQDVLEHLFKPELALREIARILRPGGAHIFTVPVFNDRPTVVRAAMSPTGVDHFLPPDYHGLCLVVREWGEDLVDFVANATGLHTEVHSLHDRNLGLDGWSLDVFVTRKESSRAALPNG